MEASDTIRQNFKNKIHTNSIILSKMFKTQFSTAYTLNSINKWNIATWWVIKKHISKATLLRKSQITDTATRNMLSNH